MRTRTYAVHWLSHGQYPTHDTIVATDARDAVRRFVDYCPRAVSGVTVLASGERVAEELYQ